VLEPNVVISAVGAFSTPKLPDIPGLDRFEGTVLHTAAWPQDGVELDGLRVGVVGTGASAMQVVPAIAERVSQLTVFQRSPGWIAPFPYHHAEIPEPLRRLGSEVPLYHVWDRIRWSWTFNDRLYSALQKDPEWEHPERAVSAENDAHRRYFTRYLEKQVAHRPELAAAMLPDYPPFGKRILLDNGWFDALTRDDVRLVTGSVAEVTDRGVVTDSGEPVELDVLIYATGFDVVRFLDTIDVTGRSGQSLREAWDDDNARAYLGTTVPDFPNLFILYGPNIQPGHGGSLVGLAEMQAGYVTNLIGQMFADGLGAVECREAVWEEYNRRVDAAHEQMVWTHPGMSTYYRNARGRVVVPGPFRNVDLWHRLGHAELDDYRLEPAHAAG
jgi:4-hydroxyacetophenone monooxygenase